MILLVCFGWCEIWMFEVEAKKTKKRPKMIWRNGILNVLAPVINSFISCLTRQLGGIYIHISIYSHQKKNSGISTIYLFLYFVVKKGKKNTIKGIVRKRENIENLFGYLRTFVLFIIIQFIPFRLHSEELYGSINEIDHRMFADDAAVWWCIPFLDKKTWRARAKEREKNFISLNKNPLLMKWNEHILHLIRLFLYFNSFWFGFHGFSFVVKL